MKRNKNILLFYTMVFDKFKTIEFKKYYKQNAVVFDAKAVVDRSWMDARL